MTLQGIKCPHCCGRAVTRPRKLLLGPGFVTSCRSCGKRVTTGARSLYALGPALLGLILADTISTPGSATGLILMAAGWMLAIFIYVCLLPLLPGEA